MKLVNYTCTTCGYDHEIIYNDTEDQEDILDMQCPECDDIGTLKKNNLMNNCHRWYHNDSV